MIPRLIALFGALTYLLGEAVLGPSGPWVKAIPVAVLGGLVLRSAEDAGRRFAGCGLLVAASADTLIEFSFIGGLIVFLVAHLFYITAFVCVSQRLRLWRLLPIAIWAVTALPFLASRAGTLAIPVLAYGIVIFVMIWRAAAAVTEVSWNRGTIGLAGAVCFGLSDTLLGYSRFVSLLPASGLLIMGTYWTAQALIAASFLRSK